MSEARISVDQDQFICPVCPDLLKDPVTLPCGHSFCKVCINDCWDQEVQEVQNGVYSCPQCRDTFTPRPVLHTNNMLAGVVEKLQKTSVSEKQRKAQEKAERSRAERLMEQAIADLQRRVTVLEKRSYDDDVRQVLSTEHRSPPFERPDFCMPSIIINNIPPHEMEFSSIPEPESREDFLRYFRYLTLDPNTAQRNLILSERNRMVTFSKREQQYSDHPERFDYWNEVLCKESMLGRCYWEVEWECRIGIAISVVYKGIVRKGPNNDATFSRNNTSWSLECVGSSVGFYHNHKKTDLGVLSSSRIGVYLDHSAGTLSFYIVSDTMKLLHREYTKFTQPLYAGIGFYKVELGSSTPNARLLDP